jgi:hypothetical protein
MAPVRAAARGVFVAAIALLAAIGPVGVSRVMTGPAAGAAVTATPKATPTATAPRTAKPAGWVKYYIVQQPDHGQREYLFEIAAKTLGNGDLANEIFQLNKGRPQPNGGPLENPGVIRPGWILILPPNASGPGVHYGRLPRSSVPAGEPAGNVSGLSYWLFSLIGAVAALLLTLLTIALVLVDLRWRRTPGDPGITGRTAATPAVRDSLLALPGPGPRPGTFNWFGDRDRPAPRRADALIPAEAPQEMRELPQPMGDPEVLAVSWEGPRASDDPAAAQLPVWLSPDSQPAGDDELFAPRTEAKASPTGYRRRSRSSHGGRPTRRAMSKVPVRDLDLPPLSGPHVREGSGAEPEYPTMLAEVHQVLLGGDRVRITLAEDGAPESATALTARNGQRYRHYLAWAPLPYDTPEGGIAFAPLGSGDRGCLFLDLGQAPSAITIGGDRHAVTRLTDSIAHQLCTTSRGMRYTVMIVGDALPKPHPPAANWLASLDRLSSALTAYPSQLTAIVFCELGTAAEAQALSDLVADARCRIVPVVLNGPVEGPWSITTTSAAESSQAM